MRGGEGEEGRPVEQGSGGTATQSKTSQARAGHSTCFWVTMFGPFAVEADGRRLSSRDFGGLKPKRIFEILLLARGRPVSKDRLADLVWGERLPQNVSGTLETYISVLRRRLSSDGGGHRVIVTEPEAYRVSMSQIMLDLDGFDALLAQAQETEPGSRRACLEQALALAKGDLLEDEPYADWAEEPRARYRESLLQARLEAAEAALAEQDYQGALAHAEAATAIDPLCERAYRTSMLALYALGRQHEALRVYARCRETLCEQVGLEPMEETEDLQRSILRRHDPAALLPSSLVTAAPAAAPAGASALIGRSEELAGLERLVESGLAGSFSLAFVRGEAGVGKTALLDELVPRLKGTRLGRSSCRRLERELPYVPLAMALRQALLDVSLEAEGFPALGEILPELQLAGPQEGLSVRALESLVELIRRHAPLVLVFDDLHWADPSTIAALGYLQRRCAEAPVAVIAGYRPEEVPHGHPIYGLEPAGRIELKALTPEELEPLGIPGLFEQTGGHPPFVAAALAGGSMAELPTSVAELVLERCRAEGDYAYRVLLAASILPAPFEPDVLARILGVDSGDLVEELERLCERGLLRIAAEGFAYRYEQSREILCRSLSPARRRLLRHRALEALRQPENVPVEIHERGLAAAVGAE